MNAHAISDEDLVAYLDGELEPAQQQGIEAQLATDPDLRARMDALSIDTAELRAAFDTLLPRAPDAPEIKATAVNSQTHRRVWPSVIAACVAGALAAGTIGMFIPEKQSDWRDYVAAYQALYVGQTLSQITPDEDQQLKELIYVGEALGKNIPLETLAGTEGLNYMRAQVLGFEGRPLAQFAFLSETGAPVALCIIRIGASTNNDIALTKMEGMSTAHWSRDGFGYMLIGGTDDESVKLSAEKFAAVI